MRKLDNFLKGYLRYTENTEVPEYFSLWCGISAISACLARKCFIKLRPIVYPNLYVVLVAESALCRKSTAIEQAVGLLKQITSPPKTFAQKTTPEAFISQIKDSEIKSLKDSKTQTVIYSDEGAQGMLVADELATLINIDSFKAGLVSLLTTMWDSSQKPFKYLTRAHGEETITSPCLSLLGGTTMDWLRSSIPEEAIGGGFTSRIVFVHSARSGKYIALPEYSAEQEELERSLVSDLNDIRFIEGEFKLSRSARTTFCEIYEKFLSTSDMLADKNLSGYAGRRHMMLHKVAMALSAAESSGRTLEEHHYLQAHEFLSQTELNMSAVLQSLGRSPVGDLVERVAAYIEKQGKVQRSQLVRKFSHKLTASELDEVIRTLEASCQVTLMESDRILYYIWNAL